MISSHGRRTALAVTLIGMAGCGSDSPAAPENTEPVATNAITVRDNFFTPSNVSVPAGETLTWTWAGGDQHNVTWVAAGLPNSPTQSSGAHQVTLSDAVSGTLSYYCTIHGTPTSGMRGLVQVQ
ncbi:MAG: plastocyanin/azurin family copper-binding protein [Gemmatimonadota bacterium]